MERRYDFDWVHREAAQIGYGSIEIRLDVSGGNIVNAEITVERRKRSLQDQERERQALIT